ncbi:unnamed protein product [Haemonchus placei]|uniref:4Fe-4S ferredoxin-type domain-containing protein n=1 Tax=Haemonchus placei TaxID=6290 RepID=A0A0N4XC25_HAEPC|nr:unnamed protein product [Haemonchus placei]
MDISLLPAHSKNCLQCTQRCWSVILSSVRKATEFSN